MGLKDRLATANGAEGAPPASPPPTPSDGDLASIYRAKLLEEIDLSELTGLDDSQRRPRLERVVGRLLTREGPILSTTERSALIRRIVDAALGLGVIEPLLADETITEIMVNDVDEVWIERDGRLERIDTHFTDETQLYQTIERIVSRVNRRVDESSPMVDARLPGGERVNVIIPPLALTGPTLTIRRFPKAYTPEQLVEMGSFDAAMRELMEACVRARLNMIVSGGTATGKTTLLNSVSAFIPADERIITIEDSAELQLVQPHVISLEARPPNVEGKGLVTIRDLVRNSLRMRPDRIVVGEVRGAETLDMLQAMNTGHDGSLTTVHANSAEDAILRLATLASMSDLDIPYDALRDQINGAIDVIVQLQRGPDGSRRVAEIAAVASKRRETFRLATVAHFEAAPLGADRSVRGEFRYFQLPDLLADRLAAKGEEVPVRFRPVEAAAEAPVRAAD